MLQMHLNAQKMCRTCIFVIFVNGHGGIQLKKYIFFNYSHYSLVTALLDCVRTQVTFIYRCGFLTKFQHGIYISCVKGTQADSYLSLSRFPLLESPLHSLVTR